MLDFLPQLPYTLKFVLILTAGVVLLRVAGKRSIAQLSVPEAVLMIAIGTILVQPVAEKSEWMAVYGGILLVAGMILVSFLQIWMPWTRKWLFGVPSAVIKDGQVDVDELKRTRMTQDQLEMRLRQLQVGNILDVKSAVLEPSGQLSIVLTENKKTAEKGDIQKVIDELQQLKMQIAQSSHQVPGATASTDITAYNSDSLFQEAEQEDQEDTNLKM
ncbi:MAG TPA: YetF domain-containing protein [Bacillales bacterium]|nr:YetF domain-containing protein [Bacillales bacterium]